MSVYYQHISEKDWGNVSKSIGDERLGLKFFSSYDILGKINRSNFQYINEFDKNDIEIMINSVTQKGVQVWGAPESALPYMKGMKSGDFFLICDRENVRYAGQVLFRFLRDVPSLSEAMWGSDVFSNIIILYGEIVSYPWSQFKKDLSYSENYFLRGVMKRVNPDKIKLSRYQSEDNFIAEIMCSNLNLVEGAEKNRKLESFARVKVRPFQSRFRKNLFRSQGQECAVCGIAYPEILEAAHIMPKSNQGDDECDNGIILCALHHKMFDMGMFSINPDTYNVSVKNDYTYDGLKISNINLNALRGVIRHSYVEWRWREWGGDF